MMKVSSFRVKDSYRGWGDGQVGMGEIEGDMMRGGLVCGIDRDPALREGVGVRNRDAAGDGDMLKSIGAVSAPSHASPLSSPSISPCRRPCEILVQLL